MIAFCCYFYRIFATKTLKPKQQMFDRQFQLRYFEMNKFGEASPVTMLTLLEEAASDHCTFINHGLYDLYAQNVAWLLISGYMEMKRYPGYKEKITVRTWLSDLKAARGYRENLIDRKS